MIDLSTLPPNLLVHISVASAREVMAIMLPNNDTSIAAFEEMRSAATALSSATVCLHALIECMRREGHSDTSIARDLASYGLKLSERGEQA